MQVAVPRSRAPLRVQNLRVNNVEIPNSKRVEISLQYIYGIGSTTAKQILVNTVSCTVNSLAWPGSVILVTAGLPPQCARV